MTDTGGEPISSRWVLDFEKQLQRRKHILLYGNIHDQFLWRDEYHALPEFLPAYFTRLGFELIVQYDPVDGFRFADDAPVVREVRTDARRADRMRRRFDEIVRHGVLQSGPGPFARPAAPPPPAPSVSGPPASPGATATGGAPGFTAGASHGSATGGAQPAADGRTSGAGGPAVDATASPPRSAPGLAIGVTPARRIAPEEAFGSLRMVLGQA
ncbi:MAG TPA: hypothetical protein VKT77_17095, partial [Chthonomonadaceae bacterium]|nr:hypothetical protein [Chthonomonadaceae bacterium]